MRIITALLNALFMNAMPKPRAKARPMALESATRL